MTRLECEKKLLSLAEQMYALYKEYNPSGDFLTMCADTDGYIGVHDCYFNTEGKIIDDVHGNAFRTVDCAKYSSGNIRLGNKHIRPEAAA